MELSAYAWLRTDTKGEGRRQDEQGAGHRDPGDIQGVSGTGGLCEEDCKKSSKLGWKPRG